MNYFNQNQNYNPMAPAQAQPMVQPGVAPNPYQIPVQPQTNPMQPGMVNPMYQQPPVPGDKTRIFEDKKDKMTPAVAYWMTQGFRIRI